MALGWLVFVGLFVGLTESADADQFVFELDPSGSSVNMTAFGLLVGNTVSTSDTENIPLGGTLTLEVDVNGSVVQSVDFVSLQFDYLAVLSNPTIFNLTALIQNPQNGEPPGTELQARLPWNPDEVAGNPVTPLDPVLTLSGSDKGTETGTAGDLVLTGATFGFEATGQYINDPDPEQNGFPINFGPYPDPIAFPSEVPGTDFIPNPDDPLLPGSTTPSPAPTGPNFLDGTVQVSGNQLIFDGTFLSFGVGGGGLLKTAQIHEGTFSAVATLFEPLLGDYDGDGTVGQGDLDLVLAFWGDAVLDGQSPDPTWVNADTVTSSLIGQDELAMVLQNWGNTSSLVSELAGISDTTGLSESQVRALIPEPGTTAGLLMGLGTLALRRRRRS